MSLPTPPSSPIAGQQAQQNPFDITPEPTDANKKSRIQPDAPATPGPKPGSSAQAQGQSTPPNRVSSNNMDVDEPNEDPFAAPKAGGKRYKGRGFQPRDGKIRTYV